MPVDFVGMPSPGVLSPSCSGVNLLQKRTNINLGTGSPSPQRTKYRSRKPKADDPSPTPWDRSESEYYEREVTQLQAQVDEERRLRSTTDDDDVTTDNTKLHPGEDSWPLRSPTVVSGPWRAASAMTAVSGMSVDSTDLNTEALIPTKAGETPTTMFDDGADGVEEEEEEEAADNRTTTVYSFSPLTSMVAGYLHQQSHRDYILDNRTSTSPTKQSATPYSLLSPRTMTTTSPSQASKAWQYRQFNESTSPLSRRPLSQEKFNASRATRALKSAPSSQFVRSNEQFRRSAKGQAPGGDDYNSYRANTYRPIVTPPSLSKRMTATPTIAPEELRKARVELRQFSRTVRDSMNSRQLANEVSVLRRCGHPVTGQYNRAIETGYYGGIHASSVRGRETPEDTVHRHRSGEGQGAVRGPDGLVGVGSDRNGSVTFGDDDGCSDIDEEEPKPRLYRRRHDTPSSMGSTAPTPPVGPFVSQWVREFVATLTQPRGCLKVEKATSVKKSYDGAEGFNGRSNSVMRNTSRTQRCKGGKKAVDFKEHHTAEYFDAEDGVLLKQRRMETESCFRDAMTEALNPRLARTKAPSNRLSSPKKKRFTRKPFLFPSTASNPGKQTGPVDHWLASRK